MARTMIDNVKDRFRKQPYKDFADHVYFSFFLIVIPILLHSLFDYRINLWVMLLLLIVALAACRTSPRLGEVLRRFSRKRNLNPLFFYLIYFIPFLGLCFWFFAIKI